MLQLSFLGILPGLAFLCVHLTCIITVLSLLAQSVTLLSNAESCHFGRICWRDGGSDHTTAFSHPPVPLPHFHLRQPDVYTWENFPVVSPLIDGMVVGDELPGPEHGQMGLADHLEGEAGTPVEEWLDPFCNISHEL